MPTHIHKEDYYKTLQVQPDAHPNVIRAAYIQLSKLYHPDVTKDKNSEEKMKQLNIAYEILKDPVSRKKYDFNYGNRYNESSTIGVPDIITYFNARRKKGIFTDKIIVTWEAPLSDFPILKYDLQSNNLYTDYKWITLETDDTSATIDKVIIYTKHTFRIRAINRSGAGQWATFKEGDKFVW